MRNLGLIPAVLAPFLLVSAAGAQPYNRSIRPSDLHFTPDPSGVGGMVSGTFGLSTVNDGEDRDLSVEVLVYVDGELATVSGLPGGGGTQQRLIVGWGTPWPNPGGPNLYNCQEFCIRYCLFSNGDCTWGITPYFCQCMTPCDFGPWVWVGRFAVPAPTASPGDLVMVELRAKSGAPATLPEIDTSDDAAAFIIGNPCNRADLTGIGGTTDEPVPADNQLTLDDILLFVNLFSNTDGCPGPGPSLGGCCAADVADIGDTSAGPDGELTLDDILAFVNAFSDGC